MNKKNRGASTPRVIFIFTAALIAVLAVFAVYQFLRADTLAVTLSQAQTQLDNLQNQLQDMQKQNSSLQSQNASLESQNKSLKEQAAATPTATATTNPNQKVAYLTFDDGPTEYTPAVLKVLKQLDIKATFFISFQGSDSPEKRALLEQEASEGHTIGVHCWNHAYEVCYKNEQAFMDDFNHMKSVIEEVTGITPKINRFPGGTDNTTSIKNSHTILIPTLIKDVTALGYKTFDWNAGGQDADPNDPNRPTTASAFSKAILNQVGSQKNLVILIHDKFPFAADTVSAVVKELKKKGYTFDVLTPDSPDCMRQPATKS